jgi:F0F1-type ATP synthase epsilon subunit
MKAVLCSQLAEDGYDIDKARANDSLNRARTRLEERKEGIDIARAKASMERALIRLEAKSLSEGRSIS